jgi:rod shape-determining protein MreD
MLTISWALLRGTREGATWGFIGGLALDLVSASPLGLCALLVTLTGFLAALGQIRIYRANILIPPLTMFLATAGYNLALLLAYQAMGRSTFWPQAITQIVLPTALFNTILMPLVYLPLTWIHHRLSPSQLGW